MDYDEEEMHAFCKLITGNDMARTYSDSDNNAAHASLGYPIHRPCMHRFVGATNGYVVEPTYTFQFQGPNELAAAAAARWELMSSHQGSSTPYVRAASKLAIIISHLLI